MNGTRAPLTVFGWLLRESSQVERYTINANFNISAGWMVMKKRFIQRRAPPCSIPIFGRKTRNDKKSAARRSGSATFLQNRYDIAWNKKTVREPKTSA